MPSSADGTRRRVLSLDGGGIRGLFTARLLERLEGEVPGFLEKVELFTGTSTGGILALALASGQSPGRMAALYKEHGRAIFDDSWLDDLKDLGGLRGADYDSGNLKRLLEGLFGELRLGGLGRRVLVCTFDLDNEAADPAARHWKPKFFHNYPGPDSDAGERVVDVALRTCAAPTQFPSYQGYVDGGVVANNPSMVALAQTLDARTGVPARLEDVVLLSVGTGTSLKYLRGQRLDWGYAQWARPIVQLMLEGSIGVAAFQCRQILGDRYHRLAPLFPPGTSIPPDAVNRVGQLESLAQRVDLGPSVAWLRSVW